MPWETIENDPSEWLQPSEMQGVVYDVCRVCAVFAEENLRPNCPLLYWSRSLEAVKTETFGLPCEISDIRRRRNRDLCVDLQSAGPALVAPIKIRDAWRHSHRPMVEFDYRRFMHHGGEPQVGDGIFAFLLGRVITLRERDFSHGLHPVPANLFHFCTNPGLQEFCFFRGEVAVLDPLREPQATQPDSREPMDLIQHRLEL